MAGIRSRPHDAWAQAEAALEKEPRSLEALLLWSAATTREEVEVLRDLKKRENPDCVPEPGEHLDLGKPDIIANLLPHELAHSPLSAPGFGCAGRHHFDWTLGREPRAVAGSAPLAFEDQSVARGPHRAPMRSSFRMASASHWQIKV